MKYRVRIGDRWFEVEVGDLHTRPIIASVDGERFEVWPETERAAAVTPAAPVEVIKLPTPVKPAELPTPPAPRGNGKEPFAASAAGDILKAVRAPIPGVIVSVAVQPEASVVAGQELCVLEAMKMKNSIRATRSGRIAVVRVAPGQAVKHRDVLMEFDE